uniref:Protein kinase domain-containing protein n=1 Tax=Caenorhabditis tropicalis TaxID=1561998 RepID=A0A1I7TNZ7_9PELO
MLRRGVILQTCYRLRHELGRGTFGVVFSAHDGYRSEYVAIKMLEKKDDEQFESGITEIRALREIGTLSGVPKMLHYFETSTHLGIAMREELETLETQYKTKRPPWFQDKTVVAIGWQLTKILETTHQKNLVHRDIDSSNIMISIDHDTRAPLLIIDWGVCLDLAKVRDPNRRDIYFAHSFSVSSRMARGLIATKKCDMIMSLYLRFF